MFERCFSWYASLLNRHPFLVLIFTGLVCTVASAFAGWANYGAFSWNPEIGFETRGTEYAGRRLAWEALLNELFAVNGKTQEVKYKQRVERDAEKAPSATPQWALQFLNAVASTPCSSYEANVPQMEYLSQVVFQVPTFDALFSMDVMGELCALHGAIQRPMEHFAFLTPFRNTWTLPNYATCLSPLLHLNCSFVTREDIEHLRRTVLFCGQFRRQIIACTTAEGPCDQLPSNCSSKLVHDLFFRILPENIMDPSVSPVFVNVFLPIYSYEGYRTAGYREATIDKFESMNRAIMDYADNCTHIALKGVYMDLKMVQFGHRMGLDTRWGILAIILVVAIIYGYCGSIFYTLMIVVSMAFSCGTAFFMYTTVFGIKFFPFMNFLVAVLLVGIGSDDTFVLSFIFARSIRETDGMINRDTVYSALSHSALSMFVTSATTAVAFYANIISDVIVIRCFGIYAGTTMMLNYILVVTWLPAALIVLHRYINPACVRIAHLPGIRLVVEPLAKANDKVNRTIGSWVLYCMEDALPFVVNKGKYVWLVGLTGLMVGGTMISFYSPGLRLPERNPLQLFKNSHPFEWYDNNAELLFTFAARKFQVPIYVRLVWGFHPISDASLLDPANVGKLSRDPRFHLNTPTKVRQLARIVRVLREASVADNETDSTYRYWPERFLVWSERLPCRQNSSQVCCNISHRRFNQTRLPKCLEWASNRLGANYGDTPIFLNGSNELVGYTMRLNTRYRYSGLFNKLNEFFTNIDDETQQLIQNNGDGGRGGWFVTDMTLVTRWYDLLLTLLHGTPMSVVGSVAVALVVVVVSTRTVSISIMALLTICGVIVSTIGTLVAMGWRISVYESTIVILTVGLSFDFTLHYAVAYKLAPKGSRRERVTYSFGLIGLPVLLSAVTTFVAGLAMVPSETQAFYQIGVFMMVVTASSWIYSSLFFTSFLLFFGPEDSQCSSCVSLGCLKRAEARQ